MPAKPLTADEIRNRVVEVKKIRFSEIAAHPHNPRRHPDNQRDAFRGAVREIGFASVPVAYHSERADGALVWADGHLRGSEAASYEGEVAILDITDAEADMLLVTADPIAYLAQTDAAALEALLRDVQTSDIALQQMLADMAEEAGITKKAVGTDTEPQIDKAEELRVKWGVQPGDLWVLGEHRLVCGDCTDKTTVDRVMGGDKGVCVWTDPPYGVDYVGKTKDALTIENDGADGLLELLTAAFCAADTSALADGSSYYIAAPAGQQFYEFATAIKSVGWRWHETLVWVKNSMVLGHSDYHYKHEAIFYGWKGTNRQWYAGRDQVSVFEIDRPSRSEEHPTMKPVELVQAMLQNSTRRNDVVYEPFSGSGTTLIACENLSRRCRAIEISPGYVAVALERWHQHTARQPERVE